MSLILKKVSLKGEGDEIEPEQNDDGEMEVRMIKMP